MHSDIFQPRHRNFERGGSRQEVFPIGWWRVSGTDGTGSAASPVLQSRPGNSPSGTYVTKPS